MTTGEIITLLQARGFRFTHSLGQNFLIDDEMLEEIVRASGASGRNVLEIGAGAGCLTNVLARSAERDVCAAAQLYSAAPCGQRSDCARSAAVSGASGGESLYEAGQELLRHAPQDAGQ